MIDWHFVVAMSCLLAAIILGISLAIANAKDEGRRERALAARREYKKEKNRRLAKFLGIPYDK